MRIDIADDIDALRDWHARNRGEPGAAELARGAAWMLARVSGVSQQEIERAADVGIAMPMSSEPYPTHLGTGNAPPMVAPLPFSSSAQPVGYYPGLGPILRHGADPREADMSQPPAAGRAFAVDLENGSRVVQLDGSFAERAARARANGDPAASPVDDGTHAEVEAMIAQVAARNSD